MLQYKTIPVTAFQQNCSLVWCDQTQEAAVIDPGGDLEAIEWEIDRLGLQLKAIWVTHAHIDHAGGVADLADKYQLDIIGLYVSLCADFKICSLELLNMWGNKRGYSLAQGQ